MIRKKTETITTIEAKKIIVKKFKKDIQLTTINREIRLGRMKAKKISGRYLINKESVEKWTPTPCGAKKRAKK